ncbi:hypothetical protein FOL47_009419 [Perkinsus chesapeaki]|uniref:Uncharacterized protein n=1 Tax=Perkinsus chesapeaki TaxID=330153 RepID=A0A7J6L8G1_PERCH|nr:hypothetical protein FOL47_009419 [Perkinsus chesapeaki]
MLTKHGVIIIQTSIYYGLSFTMDEYGVPVKCHISRSRETNGMILPGMDNVSLNSKQQVNKWVKNGNNGGVDSRTSINIASLSQTGLIPTSWVIYTDINDEVLIKIQTINSGVYGNRVMQETVVVNSEKLYYAMTLDEALSYVYAVYDIHYNNNDDAPLIDPNMAKAQLVPEAARRYFKKHNNDFNWRPASYIGRNLGGSNLAPIAYYDIPKNTAAYTYFYYGRKKRYGNRLLDEEDNIIEFEYPTGCTVTQPSDRVYCLYVDIEPGKKTLAIDLFDVGSSPKHAHLHVSIIHEKNNNNELKLVFGVSAAGCACIFQQGIIHANLSLTLCLMGGLSLDYDTNRKKTTAFEGTLGFNLTLSVDVLQYPTISAGLDGLISVKGLEDRSLYVDGYIGLDIDAYYIGVKAGITVKGQSKGHTAEHWDFQSYFHLSVWVDILSFEQEYPWSWTIYDTRPKNLA